MKNSTSKLKKQVKVNFAMAERCHYRHGNAAESEMKKIYFKRKMNYEKNFAMAERCHYCHATLRFSTLMETVPKQKAATKKLRESKKFWRRIHRVQRRNHCMCRG